MMNLRDYARHYNELYALINASRVKDAFSHPETLGDGTNWQDEIFRNALLQNYNLSIRGGTKRSAIICPADIWGRTVFASVRILSVTPSVWEQRYRLLLRFVSEVR